MTEEQHVWKSHYNGHLVHEIGGEWYYCETLEKVSSVPEKPCPRCGMVPSKMSEIDGTMMDPCLNVDIPNVRSICCGHGVHKPHLIMKDDIK